MARRELTVISEGRPLFPAAIELIGFTRFSVSRIFHDSFSFATVFPILEAQKGLRTGREIRASDPTSGDRSWRPTRTGSSAAQLERDIEELPERQRQVILLVGLEGMSYELGGRYACSRVAG